MAAGRTAIFVVARNARGRPMLQHQVDTYQDQYTHCGVRIDGWTREWSHRPLHPLLVCKRCGAA